MYADPILNVVLPDAIKGGAPFAIILNEANPMLLIVMLKRQHEKMQKKLSVPLTNKISFVKADRAAGLRLNVVFNSDA